MSAVMQPTTTHAQLNGQTVTIEHHPETAHLGRRFLAYFEAGGISAWGRCETGAIDALEEAVADELADREACAAFDAPNTKSFG